MDNYDFMLTTVDNPYNPFNQFEDWHKYDVLHGYDCCGYLAKMAETSANYSDEKNLSIIEAAIDEIVSNEPLIYKKLTTGNKDI